MWVGQIMYKYENERKKERGRGEEDREDTVGEMIDYRDRGKEREEEGREERYQRFYTAGLEDEGRKPEAKECM